MSKTTYSSKCSILGNLWLFHKDVEDEAWADYFEWSDIGSPLAYMVSNDHANLTAKGKTIIDETWNYFCELIAIDPEAKYADLTQALAASPNDPLE